MQESVLTVEVYLKNPFLLDSDSDQLKNKYSEITYLLQ